MRWTRLRIEALEILKRLHQSGKPWVRVVEMAEPDQERRALKLETLRRVLTDLVTLGLVELQAPAGRWIRKPYRLTPSGFKALEDHRAGPARAPARKLAKPKTPARPTLSPERALILMQLISAGQNGLLLRDIAGFTLTSTQQLVYKLIAHGLCERITAKPPHACRVTDAGREALREYRRYARTAQRTDTEIQRIRNLKSPVDELARLIA